MKVIRSRKKKEKQHISLQLDITRQKGQDEAPYVQSVQYETDDGSESVASALKKINASSSYKDLQGNPVETIVWENSCLQKKCGACAMLIDGKPALACGSLLRDHKGKKPMTIQPLSKFPVICDLMVDRHILFDNLKTFGMWEDAARKENKKTASVSSETFEQASEKGVDRTGVNDFSDNSTNVALARIVTQNNEHVSVLNEKKNPTAYEASRCLQCGCCLEVCPNFAPGETFFGAAGFVPASRLLSAMPKEDRERVRKAYLEHEYKGCGKSLACMDICPAEIDIESLLIHSAAASLFNR